MNEIEGMNNCLCPRAQPEGINNVHALNFIHSWTPFIHHYMIDHPSHAIILQIHTFNLPKIHEKAIIAKASSHLSYSTRITVKSMTWLECTIQNRMCVVRVHTTGRITTKFTAHFEFSTQFFFENIISFLQSNIPSSNMLEIIHLERVSLSFIKNNHTYF